MRRIHLVVSGRVQGVCYRMCCRDAALECGVTGWVRNTPSGDVEAVAEGEPAAIEQFRKWCIKGPPMARVLDVKEAVLPATGEFDQFAIRF